MKIFVGPSALLQAAVVAACLSSAHVGHTTPRRSDNAALRAQGDIAANANNFHEALNRWLKAWALAPGDPDLACNIGRVFFRIAEYPDAATWLTRCVRLMPDAKTPETVERFVRSTSELHAARERVSALIIKAERGTQIVIDSEIVLTTPLREEIFLWPGTRHLDAHNDGRSTSLEVSLEEGREQTLPIELPRVEPPPPPPPAPPPMLAPPPVFGMAPLTLPTPGLLVHVLGKDGVLPYFVTSPDMPSEPYPGGFRVWPLIVGGALTTGALVTGVVYSVKAKDAADQPTMANYQLVANLSLLGTAVFLGATLGYAVYEDRRTSVTLIGNGVSWSHKW